MDIFGARWSGYTEKLKKRWNSLVTPDDTVVIAGDISWAMSHTGALEDLRFIENLNGKKIIGRGNHDYWWTSLTKLNKMCEEQGLSTIRFLYNNAYAVENFIICGSRGWYIDQTNKNMPEEADYKKIVAREAIRLELSLTEAEKLRAAEFERDGTEREILVFLHYPPVYGDSVCTEITDVLKKHNIKRVFHGHIHGAGLNKAVKEYEGIEYKLVSCDCIDFTPFYII